MNITNVDCRTHPDGSVNVSFTIVWSDGHTLRGHGYVQPFIYNVYVPYAGEDTWTVYPADQELC